MKKVRKLYSKNLFINFITSNERNLFIFELKLGANSLNKIESFQEIYVYFKKKKNTKQNSMLQENIKIIKKGKYIEGGYQPIVFINYSVSF